jgi:hypothetical protein
MKLKWGLRCLIQCGVFWVFRHVDVAKTADISGKIGASLFIARLSSMWIIFTFTVQHISWQCEASNIDVLELLAASIIRAIIVSKLLPDYTAQQSRRRQSSYTPPWEPEISLRDTLVISWLTNFLFDRIEETECFQNRPISNISVLISCRE